MTNYIRQKLMTLSLLGLIGVSLSGLINSKQKEPPKPVYLEGKVISEKFIPGIMSEEYVFMADTSNGTKAVHSYGKHASELDLLLNPEDKFKMDMKFVHYLSSSSLDPKTKPWAIDINNLKEINGKPL